MLLTEPRLLHLERGTSTSLKSILRPLPGLLVPKQDKENLSKTQGKCFLEAVPSDDSAPWGYWQLHWGIAPIVFICSLFVEGQSLGSQSAFAEGSS